MTNVGASGDSVNVTTEADFVGTVVVRAEGEEARTSPSRRRALLVLDCVGVVGVLLVCSTYLAFFWPLLWRLPELT